MQKIKKLDKHLMNMIAAGEVVERPAGIVKELVDNAIDAKASVIKVNVEAGGIDLIQVIDNGVGMSKDDAVLAFERHATSKIKAEADLWSIETLGFRGEALPSIASVSKVKLLTNDGSQTTSVNIEYGEITSIEVAGANVGTSITVSGLFHKTPARLKNFSSVNYEMAIITGNIEKFALAYPHISFVLKHNNNEVFKTSGNDNLLEVVYQIYGRDIAKNSIEFFNEDFDFQISGVLTLPAYTRANRHHVMLFINDRMIRSYKLVNDVIKGYEKYIFNNRFPIAIIKLKMDHKLVDVNVHPTKWEVKVAKEKELSQLLRESVHKALANKMQAPKVRRLSEEKKPVQSELDLDKFESRKPTINYQSEVVDYTDFDSELPLYQSSENKEVDYVQETYQSKAEDKDIKTFPNLRLIGQMHGKYILAEDDTSLYIIDQHAAEERVNFEKISYKLKNNILETTALLFPERIQLKPSLMPLITDMVAEMAKIGLSVEVFSQDSIVVREIPMWLVDQDLSDFVLKLIDYLKDNKELSEEVIRKDDIATMACHSSIRFNRNLSHDEMLQVITNLSMANQPYHCPHGRPTLIQISEKQLIKEFLRWKKY